MLQSGSTEVVTRPLISIISPVYNEGLYVAEMAASVIGQTYGSWELLFIDDGSTDSTWEIINDLAQRDTRIRVIGDNQKKGKVAAFNMGFRASRGAAIVLLGGDDTLPETSIELRADAIASQLDKKAIGYFRLRTMSKDPKFDNIMIPKRPVGNRSGGTMVMSRLLADQAFPIPEALVAEDIWLNTFSELVAEVTESRAESVLNYRIHANNSNPRHQDFDRMTSSMHARMAPYGYLLERLKGQIDQSQAEMLKSKIRLENYRHEGKAFMILRSNRPMMERLRALATSNRALFGLRNRFFKLFSGWS